ncbi:hypothetical protein R6Q57_003516 [Mikania cordata]
MVDQRQDLVDWVILGKLGFGSTVVKQVNHGQWAETKEEDEDAYFSDEEDEINDDVDNEDEDIKDAILPLPLEFDYSSNQFRAVGENYQLFVRLVSNEVDRHASFHYRSWQEVPGEIKMSILTTLHHYFDLQRYHNTEYGEDIKQGIQSDCANRYKDRKTKLKIFFDKVGGYDNTERAKAIPPEGMNPDAWVRVTEELFTTPTY